MAITDRNAMAEVVERYGDDMLRLALLYLGNREQAEDAVQDSFLKIFRYARSGPLTRSFVTKVLVNTCKDYLKSGWVRNVHLVEEYPDTEDETQRFEINEAGALRRAVYELPSRYREVILLRYYEGFTVGEIARILGAPQPTVSIRLKRACKKLEQRLEGISREDL